MTHTHTEDSSHDNGQIDGEMGQRYRERGIKREREREREGEIPKPNDGNDKYECIFSVGLITQLVRAFG